MIFVTIWNQKINNIENNLNIIPLTYRLIITSCGSLTQNLNCFTGQSINIFFIKQERTENLHKYYNNNILREVWLRDKENYPLVFAQSFWNQYLTIHNKSIEKKAIGKLMIELEVDFYKEIKEISYGYLSNKEKTNQIPKPVWLREYIIWHNKKRLSVIKEFFFPINLFYTKNKSCGNF